jgi:hypothetical protein
MLDPLDAITERIVCKHPGASEELAPGPNLDAGTLEGVGEGREVVHDEGRVCLARGTKLGVHAHVKLDGPRPEPAAGTTDAAVGLDQLLEAEQVDEEGAPAGLTARRDRQLDVVQAEDLHERSLPASRSAATGT